MSTLLTTLQTQLAQEEALAFEYQDRPYTLAYTEGKIDTLQQIIGLLMLELQPEDGN